MDGRNVRIDLCEYERVVPQKISYNSHLFLFLVVPLLSFFAWFVSYSSKAPETHTTSNAATIQG